MILGKKRAENGVGVLIYGEKNADWRNMGVGGFNFMEIFCNIREKRGGWVFKAHLFCNYSPWNAWKFLPANISVRKVSSRIAFTSNMQHCYNIKNVMCHIVFGMDTFLINYSWKKTIEISKYWLISKLLVHLSWKSVWILTSIQRF